MATTEEKRRVCVTPGCKTRIRATNESLVCDPCRADATAKAERADAEARQERERARRLAEEGIVPCRYFACPHPATHAIGSKSPRWSNLCDEHYEEERSKARRSANAVVDQRASGQRPSLPQPWNSRSSRERVRREEEAPMRPAEDALPVGVRSRLAARLAKVAGQLDVIEAEMTILREQAKPLEAELDEVTEELGNLGRLA